jgi:hypothetical protein
MVLKFQIFLAVGEKHATQCFAAETFKEENKFFKKENLCGIKDTLYCNA